MKQVVKKLGVISVGLASLVLLGACSLVDGFKKQRIDVSQEPKSSSQVADTSSSALLENNHQAYNPVFENYETIISFQQLARDYSQLSHQAIRLSQELQPPINQAVIESVVRFPKEQRYAFYDLDKNGQDELLMASLNSDGSIVLHGLYYLQDGKPNLLCEGFVASGPMRSAMIVFQDGTVLSNIWSSGNGYGTGTLYQLDMAGGSPQTLEEREVQIPGGDLLTEFGKNKDDVLDLKGLDWQAFETNSESDQPPAKEMDLEALLKGDFSSIVGKWRNKEGSTIEIDAGGKVSGGESTIHMERAVIQDGVLVASLGTSQASSGLLLMPKGVENTYGLLKGEVDQTDINQDRLLIAQQVLPSEVIARVSYYRVE